MRWHNIVSGILLILSIIDDFALAAPVSVQEKRQERVDVVHIPKDVINSSDSTLSSNSAPSGPDHGSTNVVQPPAPDPASSTATPEPLTEPSSCSSSTSSGRADDGLPDDESRDDRFRESGLFGPLLTLTTADYGENSMNHELTWAQTEQKPVPVPVPKSRPLIHPSADPEFDWEYWKNADDPPPEPYQVDPLNPPSTSGYAPSPPEPEHEVVTPSSPSSTLGSPKEPEDEVVPGPKPSPDPELHLDHQSLSADSQPVDLQAAIYAAKGKAKETRRISGAGIDVGNAAQRELEPGERSLDQDDLTVRNLGNL
ncbi:hypothetical protein V8E52_010992 [Russula decolorans]